MAVVTALSSTIITSSTHVPVRVSANAVNERAAASTKARKTVSLRFIFDLSPSSFLFSLHVTFCFPLRHFRPTVTASL